MKNTWVDRSEHIRQVVDKTKSLNIPQVSLYQRVFMYLSTGIYINRLVHIHILGDFIDISKTSRLG